MADPELFVITEFDCISIFVKSLKIVTVKYLTKPNHPLPLLRKRHSFPHSGLTNYRQSFSILPLWFLCKPTLTFTSTLTSLFNELIQSHTQAKYRIYSSIGREILDKIWTKFYQLDILAGYIFKIKKGFNQLFECFELIW